MKIFLYHRINTKFICDHLIPISDHLISIQDKLLCTKRQGCRLVRNCCLVRSPVINTLNPQNNNNWDCSSKFKGK